MATLAKFEGYSFRQVEPSDYEQLEKWIAADPTHRDVLEPEFFMDQERPHVTVLALESRSGTVMYIRLSTASRVHIQFSPAPKANGGGRVYAREIHRYRTQLRNALLKGMAFLEVGLRKAGVNQWIFDSESPTLRDLAKKQMGFEASPNEMVRMIKPEGGA
jgi:hypothetical protein